MSGLATTPGLLFYAQFPLWLSTFLHDSLFFNEAGIKHSGLPSSLASFPYVGLYVTYKLY